MRRQFHPATALVKCCIIGALCLFASSPSSFAEEPSRIQARQLEEQGNYRDALNILSTLLSSGKGSNSELADDLTSGIACLQRLQQEGELDSFVERAVEANSTKWKVISTAARFYTNARHFGYVIAGKFSRGWARGGGTENVSSAERDRVRALQLFLLAIEQSKKGATQDERADLHIELSRAWLSTDTFRLTALTDLAVLPEYDAAGPRNLEWGGEPLGAPTNNDGSPIFYARPSSFEAARMDGERWRWALARATELSSHGQEDAGWEMAKFSTAQFGVVTLGSVLPLLETSSKTDTTSGILTLHTLAEDETIARLASGVRRFQLPKDYNYISIYSELSRSKAFRRRGEAYNALASIFQDRRQHPKAAAIWREAIEQLGYDSERQKSLDNIVGAWGTFEASGVQPAAKKPILNLRYRNATRVEFVAHSIDVQGAIDDVTKYLKSKPSQFDYQQVNIENIGYQIVSENKTKRLGSEVVRWSADLTPQPDHFDSVVEIASPLSHPGAYLVTATVAGGNSVSMVVWVADTTIVERSLDAGRFYFIADAETGKPIDGAKVRFFGYRFQYNLFGTAQTIGTKSLSRTTGPDGSITLSSSELDQEYQWMTIAEGQGNRLAYTGFHGTWYGSSSDERFKQPKLYGITDRPVYRPAQEVKYTLWLRTASYDQGDSEPLAHASRTLTVINPRGEIVQTKRIDFDSRSSAEGTLTLDPAAPLGTYSIQIEKFWPGVTFRVEEYKKPEFEVTVSPPKKPLALGDPFEVSVEARYLFGAPVTHAKVSYKVLRSEHSTAWYPARSWDWLYGNGYWWSAQKYDWYPGWARWGCLGPLPWWFGGRPSSPPEVVQSRTTEIGADGTLKIPIETALARELHGDTDHRYEITVEVTDESRRTIVGKGSAIAAREPFKVYVWLDNGLVRTNDTVAANFTARTPDGQPVGGSGQAVLYAVSYDKDRTPTEHEVFSQSVASDPQGQGTFSFRAPKPGQYRLAYRLTDGDKRTIEGAHVFSVMGPSGEAAPDQRFNELELVLDKSEYAPGDTAKVVVNTDQANGTVLLFVKSTANADGKPRLITTTNRSTTIDLPIQGGDMPNFFVDAFTVRNARLHSVTKEVVVPPAQRILNVSVTPEKEKVSPGDPIRLEVKLTDANGKPTSGRAVVTAYDRALEYISGGSNVPEIKEFFWKWRRTHSVFLQTNLSRIFLALVAPGQRQLEPIGAFGHVGVLAVEAMAPAQSFGGTQSRSMKGMELSMATAPLAEAAGAAADDDSARSSPSGSSQQTGAVVPVVRSLFADTAFWAGGIEVDPSGVAKLEFKAPDNLTTWKIRAWGLGSGTRVGEATSETITTKDLLIRLQTPRFLVETDELVLSSNVHNYTPGTANVEAKLELTEGLLEATSSLAATSEIPSGGEHRFDFTVRALSEGSATIRSFALSEKARDAMQITVPVKVHGMLKTDSFSGAIAKESSAGGLSFSVPEARRPEQSRVEVRFSPSLAASMIDALPYLHEYPYGCTEQTLSRFLPTVVTLSTLRKLGVNLASVRDHITNLNAQELATKDDKQPKHSSNEPNPVFDEAKVAALAKSGVDRLVSMQLSDGGWGWFSGFGETASPHLTAYVVQGLKRAVASGIAVPSSTIDRGISFLKTYEATQLQRLRNALSKTEPFKKEADNLDAFVNFVLSESGAALSEMRQMLMRDRLSLSAYGQALVGLACLRSGDRASAEQAVKNIEQYLKQDTENQTAYLELGDDGYWWYWHGDEIEAHAYYLKLLVALDPKSTTAPKVVKYLLNNRRNGTYWKSTRDTAIVVDAFAEYLTATGEMIKDLTINVLVDGISKREVKITPANLFTFDNSIVLAGKDVSSGKHRIEFKKNGDGPLFFNTYVTNFTLEDDIGASGLEVKVERRFYRLDRDESATSLSRTGSGTATEQQVERFRRVPLAHGEVVASGALVEVELEIESKNDYEYLVFEDMKAAGFEPVGVQSGYNGNAMGAYVEYRDDRTAFFVRQLPRGKRSVAYRLRAEIPGRFSALPAIGYAMYAPELKGNSSEWKIGVKD